MMKPIKIWVSAAGPNAWKVVLLLEELGIEYELKLLSWEELMGAEYSKINPGGKVPAMYDPNNDMLWESGAIILYLIDEYDTEKELTCTTLKEKNLLNQWLMFQMSQQGPIYGQVGGFNVLHPEKVPSVIKRYTQQVERILGILESSLEGREWLVGSKRTFADLSFFMWHVILPLSMACSEGQSPLAEFPNLLAWHERMAERESVRKILATIQVMMDSKGLGSDAMPTDTSAEDMVKKMELAAEKNRR